VNFIKKIYAPIGILDRTMEWLSPLFLLGLRAYVANAFFKSGLTKIMDFSSTVALFENEYKVPIISPTLAAVSGTAAELILPALLLAGLASRPTALALFVFNIVAVVSYPDISDSGVKDHFLWGTMILVVAFFGSGRLSFDHEIKSRLGLKTG
jgi:putative oxidoreductase